MLIFEKEGIITSAYDEERNVIIFKWHSFNISLDDIKKNHNTALEVGKKNNCFIIIADTSEITDAFNEDIVPWFANEWIPYAKKQGLKYVVTVVPQTAIGEMSTEEWQATDLQGIKLYNVKSIEEAYDIIKTFQ